MYVCVRVANCCAVQQSKLLQTEPLLTHSDFNLCGALGGKGWQKELFCSNNVNIAYGSVYMCICDYRTDKIQNVCIVTPCMYTVVHVYVRTSKPISQRYNTYVCTLTSVVINSVGTY